MLKHCVVVGGPNGAGKSTFAFEYLRSHPYEYVCADEYAKQINPDAPETVPIAAGRMFIEKSHSFIQAGTNMLIESTLSGKSQIRLLEKAKANGYEITMIFVFVRSADQSVARVKSRVRQGGHNVPESDIRRRFTRACSNFWNFYRFCPDRWHMIYNAERRFQIVASGSSKLITVRDETLFEDFQQNVTA